MNPWVIHSVAYFMADVVEAGMNDDQELNFMAKVTLNSIFGDVPEEYRGTVYIKFLDILTDRGVEFGNEQAVLN